MKKKLLTLILIITVFSLALAACGTSPTATVNTATPVPAGAVIAEGRIRPVKSSMLSFQARGVVDEVLVKTGDKVKAGDVLVRLANADQAAAQLLTAQQAFDLLIRNEGGDRAKFWAAYMDAQKTRAAEARRWEGLNLDNIQTREDDAKEEVDNRRIDLDTAQKKFDQYKDLPEGDARRQQAKSDLEDAQDKYNEAIRKVETIMRERDVIRADYDAALAAETEAKHQYEISLDGPNSEKLALAKAQVSAAKDALANYELKAPFDGVVAEVSVDAGEQIGPETVAVSVANFGRWIVETTDVTELEVVKISKGQQVSMIPDALPDVKLIGTVESIGQSYKQQSGDIIYTVRIKVDNVDERVRWGMTVEATFK